VGEGNVDLRESRIIKTNTNAQERTEEPDHGCGLKLKRSILAPGSSLGKKVTGEGEGKKEKRLWP